MDNTSFDCGEKAINKDLQETLNTEEHPQITLTLREVETTETPSKINATIAIKIAGVSRDYKIPLQIKKNGNLYVSGQLKIKLSDYNLETPKKLFGLITVNDNIEIVFHLELQQG